MNHFKLLRTPQTARRWAALRQLAAPMVAVLGLIVFSNAVPTVCLPTPSESEAPVKQTEAPGEAIIHLQNRMCVCPCRPRLAVRVAVQRGESRTIVAPSASRPGHRLHNSLLAPLRC